MAKRARKKTTSSFEEGLDPGASLIKSQAMRNAMAVNGLSESILGFAPGGIGTQLSQVDTIFLNERWYLISNMRQVLSQCYVEHGLIQAVVDTPVDDAFRGGYDIKTKMLSESQIEELKNDCEEEGLNTNVIGRGRKWTRLFGGGGIVIMTDQDPATPLDIAAIGPYSNMEFRAVDMWELFYSKQNMEGFNPAALSPTFEYYDYYGMRLHKSRVKQMRGLEAPSFIRPRLRGWGFSIVEALVQSINQFLKSKNLTFEVLDEFKLDIFGFDGLTQTLLSAGGTQKVQERAQLASQQKNYLNSVVMDAKDRYDQKQLSFSGLAEIMKEFRIQIASDMRMPMTKLFGISASGFNSGEDDIENYNGMVEGQVRTPSKPEIIFLLKLKCQQKWGMVPSDLSISYKPMRILSSGDEETVKTSKFNRVVVAMEKGLCTLKEAKESINRDNLLPVQVDTSIETLPLPQEGQSEGQTEEEAAIDKAEDEK